MADFTQPGRLPAPSSGGATAGAGGTVRPLTHLPPVRFNGSPVPSGPASTEQSRSFASAQTLNDAAAATVTAQTSLISAAGKYVPVSYGNCRWSGYCYFFDTHPTTGALVIGLALSEGEVQGDFAVEANNAPLRSGCTVTAYTGTSGQAVDPTITALVLARYGATYTDALPGIAHVVLNIPSTTYTVGELRGFDVSYRGKKIFNPRDGTQTATNTATWKYSANAGDVLTDFLTSGQAIARGVIPRYGRRVKVTAASQTIVGNQCDELIGNAPNLYKRSEIHTTLLTPTANETIEQAMRTHAMCYVDRLADQVTLLPDAARTPVMTVDASSIIKFEAVSERAVFSSPTMLDITYIDTSVKPWRRRQVRIYDPRVLTGEIPEVPGSVDLSMCQSYTMVQALGRRRLNTTVLSARSWGISMGAAGLALQKSDVFAATHPLGMTNKWWIVDTATDRGFGEVHLKVSEYDAGCFKDVVQTTPATLGSGVANCASVPAIAGLAATQRSVNELQTGGSWACILRANVSWTAATFPCLQYYEVQVLSGATLIETANVGTNTWRTSALSTGTYTIQVRCVSGLLGQSPGAWTSTSITIAAATCPPVATQAVRVYGWNSVRDVFGDGIGVSNEHQRVILCDSPLTTVTRTEIWFGWGANPTFGSATKMRDDAGAQTAWCLRIGAAIVDPAYHSWQGYATLALGSSASVPTYPGGYSWYGYSTGSSGTYPNAVQAYGGGGPRKPPTKVWVRFVNGAVASEPVEVLCGHTADFPTFVAGSTAYSYMADGSLAVAAASAPASVTFTTDLAAAYAFSAFLIAAGKTSSGAYNYVSGSSHKITGSLYDSYGDLVSGYVQWQAWKL